MNHVVIWCFVLSAYNLIRILCVREKNFHNHVEILAATVQTSVTCLFILILTNLMH